MSEEAFIEERQRLVDAAKEIFNSTAGEIVLDKLKNQSGFNSSNFSSDALEMSYREGQRSVVLYILNLLVDEKVQQQQGE
tara:strand:+ start:1990 stop:2229 length:240 start_codon:yes stop_codon:yes gene_type:complete